MRDLRLLGFRRNTWRWPEWASPEQSTIFGPCVWLVMSLVVIPLLRHQPTSITYRWWIQLVGHFPFVGLPIVASIARVRAPVAAPAIA